ncbi:glycosyltransferase [Clostridium tyrobutyricum]|uniref:glycosyltransferase n=2 Tax=Clostridium tyrobutyricum TaxID=1519 RepID=UPI0010C54079|nr:glycosyltransferase [Clostridium tyrobutyricum]QCH28055.1 Putative teichuronic acid biosynthesis glycosyltransferase TuaC [Clostridium tyrobutyricum]
MKENQLNMVENINVLVISHMYPSNFNEMSGIFVHEQVKSLLENGCRVKVVSPVPWAPFPINKTTNKWKRYSKIPYKDIKDSVEIYHPRYLEFPKGILFDKSGYFMSKGMNSTISKIWLNFKFNIIHSNVALPDGYGAMIINKKYNVPHIVTVHGQDFQNTINRNSKCKSSVFKVLNSVDRIITVSRKLSALVKKEKFYNKIDVVNNGIDRKFINRNYIENKFNGKIKILSVSNLKKAKGIHINLEAINQLKNKYSNIQYDIIGEGEFEYKLKNLVKNLKLENIVNFLGKKSHNEVISCMSNYNIFSLPSYNEGFGMVYIEAMSQGIPVIGVKGEGIEDVIENGYNGFLVNRKDIDSLVNTLDILIKDDRKRNEVGINGKNTVINNFTWDDNAKKVIKLYKEFL